MSLSVSAEPIGVDKAAEIAKSFAKCNVREYTHFPKGRAVKQTDSDATFYVFGMEQSEGFVIVSGESVMPEIVGYSFTSSIDMNNMPAALEAYLADYATLVDAVRAGEVNVNERLSQIDVSSAVAPLCTTEWGQGAPYNALCPAINNVKCPCGCVATALAQIMFYHSWPKVGRGGKSYSSGIESVGVIKSEFSDHEYAWDVMKKTTSENLASDSASAAVAQLCYDCGIAVHMNYDTSGSGAYDDDLSEAMYRYFGYKASTIHLETRVCYATQKEWDEMIMAELIAGRPVAYSGDGDDGGHEFIVDGFDTDGFFHINWGWNGLYNGYFRLFSLDDKSKGISFNEGQSALLGVEPDYEGNDYLRVQQVKATISDAPYVSVDTLQLGKSFSFKLSNLWNKTLRTHTWYFGVGLFDMDGNLVKQLQNTKPKEYSETLNSYYGFKSYSMVCVFSKSIPDGEYMMRLICREQNYEDWILPDVEGGAHRNCINVTVKDGFAYFNQIPSSIYNICVDGSDSEVVSRTYYNINGTRVITPKRGEFIIERQMLRNGMVKTLKRRF